MQEQIEAVQRMQNYIEAHLTEEITLSELAKASMFSPWYARRIFTFWTGTTPADYIRKLRLRVSALRLRDEKCLITDVAFDLGFGSVDGYTRAFAREFGCNPKEYAKNPIPLPLFTPYGVKYQLTQRRPRMEPIRTVFIQIVEKPARRVIIKRGIQAADYWTYCEEVGCNIWGILTSIKSISGEPVCMWLPKRYIKNGTSEYVQGVEIPVDSDQSVPEGFDVITLPAAKYLMFQGEPFAEENFEDAIKKIWEAEKKYAPSVIGYEWDSENPRIQLEPIGTRGYIELLPIREIHT